MNGPIPFTDEQIQTLCSAYQDGASVSKLSDQFGVSITAIQSRLRANGVQLRRRGAPCKQRDRSTAK